MNYTISNEFYTATVSDLGAELISLKHRSGKELMWQAPDENFWSKHAPLLFPIAGRIKDGEYYYNGKCYKMSSHGFISKVIFEVTSKADDSITLVAKSNEATLLQYPFDFEFTACYSLSGNTLTATVTIKNESSDVRPFTFGWHPGFMLPRDESTDIEDYYVDFGKDVESVEWTPLINGPFARTYSEPLYTDGGKYRLNEKEIYKNDTMIFSKTPTSIRLSDGKKYSLDMSWSENTPYLCIWKEPSHDAPFICLEPWSGLPQDGIKEECFEDRPMRRLAPGASESFFTSYKFTV